MTAEEIRDVNKRLYNRLIDVKMKFKTEEKKENLRKMAEKKKKFTEVIIIYDQ